jgi:hypothetical protein
LYGVAKPQGFDSNKRDFAYCYFISIVVLLYSVIWFLTIILKTSKYQFEENKLKSKKREMVELIKNRCYDPKSFKTKLNKLYPFQMFRRPHMIVITMICRHYGEKNPQNFKLELVPLLHQIVRKGKIFN